MTIETWGILIGALVPGLLALAPWMLMVHAKLAVLTSTIASLEGKVDKLIDDNEQRRPMCAVHAARLDSIEVQLGQIHTQLHEIDYPHRDPNVP
jgi:hypothetical protein